LRRHQTAWVVAGWLVTRAFVVWMSAAHFQGDTGLYFRQGAAWWAGQVPYRDFAGEYPPAAVALFALLSAVGSHGAFRVAFGAVALLVDAVALGLLLRRKTGSLGPLAYLVATALLFPVLYVRFDLFPAVATLGACLLLQVSGDRDARPSPRALAGAGALWGMGIALKLYPLLLAPFLLLSPGREVLRWSRRVRDPLLLAGVAALVVALSFAPPLLAGAGGKVLSFLRYQGERGLQIESSYASLLMVVNALVPIGVHHQPSHQAHDLAGPLADLAATAARPLQVGVVLLVSALAYRRRLPVTRAAAAVVASALVTASVLSPQFLIWLVPLAVLDLAWSRGRDRATAVVLAAAAGLTSLVFPALYPRLLDGHLEAAVTLLVRNFLLGVLAVWLCRAPTYRDGP
jgi:hypothetical protein